MFKHQNPEYPHNLYVCDSTSLAVKNHFAFRDYLRQNPKEVALYADLKKALAQQSPNDIDSYCEGKNDFISNILKQCPFSEDELAEIKVTNTLVPQCTAIVPFSSYRFFCGKAQVCSNTCVFQILATKSRENL